MINSINEEKQFQKANDLFDKMDRTKTREGRATVVEYTKKGDNATFGVVREGSQYTIKVTNKKSSVLVAEDFDYIESYEARKRFQRTTLQEAIKYLHLYLNEEKYVVDVPVVTQTAPAPEPEMDMPTDGGMDETPPMDGEMGDEMDANMDGEMGDEGAGSDDQKEIQKMTGKLAQELRQEIADGNGPFTVGMFKSLIAPAKDLTPDLKSKVMDKAQEVLSDEGNENGGEDSEMEAMNEAIINLKYLLSEEKKEKVYTDEQVEKMISNLARSIKSLEKAYDSLINDPEVMKLLKTVYQKLYNLKSIEARKKELQGKHKKEAMKKESAVQSTISHIRKNREMAEEAKAVMTVNDYKMAGQDLKGEVRVVPNNTKFNTLKESKRITLKEFKDMMEEENPEKDWPKYQELFGVTEELQEIVEDLKMEFKTHIKGSMGAFDEDANAEIPVVEDIEITYSPREDGRTAKMGIFINPFSSGEQVLIYNPDDELEIKKTIVYLFKKMEEQMKESGIIE